MPKRAFEPTKCSEVKPFQPCRAGEIKPWCGPLQLTAKERKLFDSIATEVNKTAGTPVRYWVLDVPGSVVDPLYDEPITRKFKGPYNVQAWVGYANSTPDVQPQGFRNTWATSAWLARTDVEKSGMNPPTEGDIMEIWDIPFFADDAASFEGKPGIFAPKPGYYFNITNVSEDGHLFDTAEFVGFTLAISRNSEFTPERRIEAR